MCSAALLCDTSWSANQELQGTFHSDLTVSDKNGIDASSMNESASIHSSDPEGIARMLMSDGLDDAGAKSASNLQQVARHDSGVPEDLISPSRTEDSPEETEDDPDGTINSDCNITVIHVTKADTSCNNNSGNNETNELLESQELSQDIEPSPREFTPESKDSKDGSDSGVEGCANELPRVEYGSSCNGLDEASCDSSLVSCCSVYEDPCAVIPDDLRLQSIPTSNGVPSGVSGAGPSGGGGGGEGTSEGGSESSSVAGSVGGQQRVGRSTSVKRGSFASSSHVSGTLTKRKTDASKANGNLSSLENSRCTPRTKARGSLTAPRASSSSRNGTAVRTREGRSVTRKINTAVSTERRGSVSDKFRIPGGVSLNTATRTRTRTDCPSSLTAEIDRDLAAQRARSSIGNARSKAVSSRGRTPVMPEDARTSLVSTTAKSPRLIGKNERTPSLDDKTLDTYGTLPRAKSNKIPYSMTKSVDRTEDICVKSESARSSSRETSLSRSSAKKVRLPNCRESISIRKALPPYPRTKPTEKTRIYHEISVQTGLTSQDIEMALAGQTICLQNPSSVERLDGETQTDAKWQDPREFQAQLKTLTAEALRAKQENDKLDAERTKLERLLAEERADHAFARQELDKNSRRVLAMLGTPKSEHDESSDSFLELETHFQSSGQVVANQQIEITDLQSLCRMLNRDLEKSLAAQKSLLQQQQEFEAESAEMQDFLLEEKGALVEALNDAESEIERKNELLVARDSELARLTEECKHLVRMSEQRRQENLSLGMKLNAVERRGRELLLGQGAAVSGAAVALSGLGTRLDGLVDQLVRSYKISEKDLEDVIYHNEAYSRSNSSAESSPISSKQSLKECTPSPKRGSFVLAVIGAIRNAATHPFAARTIADKKLSPAEASKHIFKDLSTDSSSDLLDFETEPCLMMESVLEDVPLPDTYSHNMISSSDSLRRALSVPEPIDDTNSRLSRHNGESSSLTNLTQAILNRRKAEDEEEVGDCDSQSESEGCGTENNSTAPSTDYCPAANLVDQVIDVDNLVTKLLKVLRIIQLDNDTCIRDLRDDKTELESKLEAHNSELAELRKVDDDALDADEIFADAVDYRRQTVVENKRESVNSDATIEKPVNDQENCHNE